MDIVNPSNLQLETGDLSECTARCGMVFVWGEQKLIWVHAVLELFREGALMGTTLLPNLTLQMGNNSLTAQGNFTVGRSLMRPTLLLTYQICVA